MSDSPNKSKSAEKMAARRARRAKLPTIYVDTWSTLTWKGHIRVVLAEWMNDEPNYRAAFLMELEDAKKFAEYLLEIIEEREKKDAAFVAKEQAAEGLF